MTNPIRTAATLATTLALTAAVVSAAPAATPTDPREAVVLITTRTASGEAAGTGMVLTASGEVLTNYHVVRGSTEVAVEVPATGTTYAATVVGHDATRDVALLQLTDAAGLATITPDRDALAVGDPLLAVGNASGGGELVDAAGHVTALDQQVTVADESGGTETLTGVIETDAGAVPGDSGGPMFDAQGEVVGMTTAGAQTVTRGPRGTRGRVGTAVTTASYAVPIADALAVVDQIRSGTDAGSTKVGPRAWLGVSVAPARGVHVVGVAEGGPAAGARITPGSTITALDGAAVTDQAELAAALGGLEPGRRVGLAWTDADGVRHTGVLTLGESPVN